MRLVRLFVVFMVAAACAGCAAMLAAEPPVAAAPPPADLDSLMYGRRAVVAAPAPVVAAPVPVVAAPAPIALPPIPAALLPGPAPGGNEPYTLDTGDKLRIVVFGQEGLTNTYIIDASGKITM